MSNAETTNDVFTIYNVDSCIPEYVCRVSAASEGDAIRKAQINIPGVKLAASKHYGGV